MAAKADGKGVAVDSPELVDDHGVEDEAAYAIEATVKCPLCSETLSTVHVVRLLRTQVNFTSTLPRRGYVVICPRCRGIVPAAVVSWIS